MDTKKVADAVDKTGEPDNLIRLSTGVILKGKKANPLTLMEVMAAFPAPMPPEQFNATMGRMIQNSDDPDYIGRRDSWKREHSTAVLQALILLGTELHEKPKTFPGPKDDKWLKVLASLNLPIFPDNENWRYLKWVIHVACVDEKDVESIQEVVGRLSGVSKDAVKTAEDFSGSDPES
jgi:hypothetical protein